MVKKREQPDFAKNPLTIFNLVEYILTPVWNSLELAMYAEQFTKSQFEITDEESKQSSKKVSGFGDFL